MKWLKQWQVWTFIALFIFIHEAGHFVVAKSFGMRVSEFSMGFGPGVTLFRAGETDFRIGMLPLGGYNKIADMEQAVERGAVPRELAFRLAVVSVAGLLFQLGMMLGVAYLIFRLIGGHKRHRGFVIAEMPDECGGRHLGLMRGDRLMHVNDVLVSSAEDLVVRLNEANMDAVLGLQQGEHVVAVKVVPTSMGFTLQTGRGSVPFQRERPRTPITIATIDSIWAGLGLSGKWIQVEELDVWQRFVGFMKFIVASFMDFFGSVCPTEFPDFNPFVGVERHFRWNILRWVFLANMLLVVFNALPQPLSDGDKLLRFLAMMVAPQLTQGHQALLTEGLVILFFAFAGSAAYLADRFLGIPKPPKEVVSFIPR